MTATALFEATTGSVTVNARKVTVNADVEREGS